MRRIAPCLVACVLALTVSQGLAKRPPQTQFDLNVEADHSLRSAEQKMTTVLSQLRARASVDPDALALLDKAQLAWVAYRDAQLAVMWPSPEKQAKYGTVFPMCFSYASAALTNRRTTELELMLKRDEGDVCGNAYPD